MTAIDYSGSALTVLFTEPGEEKERGKIVGDGYTLFRENSRRPVVRTGGGIPVSCTGRLGTMWRMSWIKAILVFLRSMFASRAALLAENLALRQQLAILQREKPLPKLRWRDRVFCVWLSRVFTGWREWLVIVKPETVMRWHRQGFRYYWRWKSGGGRPGRPTIPGSVIALIKRMAKENVTWGAPRIQAELRLLGHDVAESTVAKYIPKGRKPPSQTWKAFLKNHVGCLVSIDFFVVPALTFRLLYRFVILAHDRRRVVHFNVTSSPSAEWVATQLRQAFPFDTATRYLIRDRDGVYGDGVKRCLQSLDIEQVLIAPRRPWQNPYVERLIGSIRRDLPITSSCSTSGTCCDCSGITSAITIAPAATWRSSTTLRTRVPSRVQRRARCSRCRWSAACTTATAAAPEPSRRRRRELVLGVRTLIGRSVISDLLQTVLLFYRAFLLPR
jgi:transposase InsO family protein